MIPDKKHIRRGLYAGIALLAIALFIVLAPRKNRASQPTFPLYDYDDIAAKGVLRAALEYNSISMFVNGDTLAGFDYELIQAFARDHGLRVDIMPEMSFYKRLRDLSEGAFDVIANEIPAVSPFKDTLLLTIPIVLKKEVLVQRKATSPDDSLFIKSHLALAKRTLHVVKGSPAILRIRNLGDEIADTIYINEVEKYGPEQLIAMVAHGDIDYAVCEEGLARAAADSMPQIDISTDISFTQFYSWAVGKHSPILLDSLNTWLERFKQSDTYQEIYQRYYGNRSPL